jgi:hypothetical protein
VLGARAVIEANDAHQRRAPAPEHRHLISIEQLAFGTGTSVQRMSWLSRSV